AATVVVAALVILGFIGISRQRDEAEAQRSIAEAGRLVADADRILDRDPGKAAHDLAAAYALHDVDDLERVTRRWAGRRVDAVLPESGGMALSVSADGRRMAITGPAAVRIWDLTTRKPAVLIPIDTIPGRIAFSPNGQMIAIGGETGEVIVVGTDGPGPA